MKRGRLQWTTGVGVLAVALLAAVSTAAIAAPNGGHGRTLLVGVASRSVLPTVDGTTDYLRAGLPGASDPYSLGVFVPRFDQGRVGVGNGDDRAFWVHDDIRVRAMAIDDPRSEQLVVLVSTDLYMVFRVDGDQIRREVAERLRAEPAMRHPRKRLEVLIAATHNHHGPDTAFGVNHTWYEHMVDQTADAVIDAIQRREPATLRIANGQLWFGAHDGVDPNVYDPTMNVLQAVRPNGHSTIATVIQWNNHPEVTLNWRPPVPPVDCVALTAAGESCETRGRYFTADFPGVVADRVHAAVGGEVLYLNGAVGDLTGPGGTEVWEIDAAHPLGDQVHAPPGAVAPGGGTDYRARNFRRAVIIGEQVAAKSLSLQAVAEPVPDTSVSFVEEPFYSRMSHRGFRYLLVPDAAGLPSGIGHNLPELYTCSAGSACVPDGGATVGDPVFGHIRAGDHLRSAVGYLRVGRDIAFVLLPGEVAGELVMGLPAGFRANPRLWYSEPELHVPAEDFHIPGYVRARVPGKYLFAVGLGNDELGYVKSLADFRVACVADQLPGQSGTCAQLHAAGVIEFSDGVAGSTCRRLADDPTAAAELAARVGVQAAQAVLASCTYGQAIGEARGHYPETNSAGWDLADDILAAVGRLTGNFSAEEVNPDFPGHNDAFPPPVGA